MFTTFGKDICIFVRALGGLQIIFCESTWWLGDYPSVSISVKDLFDAL